MADEPLDLDQIAQDLQLAAMITKGRWGVSPAVKRLHVAIPLLVAELVSEREKTEQLRATNRAELGWVVSSLNWCVGVLQQQGVALPNDVMRAADTFKNLAALDGSTHE